MNTERKRRPQQKEIRQESLVSPFIASLASAVVPGLGQGLARAVRRGLIIFFSFLSILGLLAWRMRLAARRDDEIMAIIKKAYRLEPILVVLTVLIAILYLWIILDAFLIVRNRESTPIGLLFMILVIFFVMGWQIGEINLVSMVSDADEAVPALLRIAWPWEEAIDYPKEYISADAPVQVPCTDDPPDVPEPVEGEPYIKADPTCGVLSEQGGEGGTVLTLEGRNFKPENEIEILWEDPIGSIFRQRQEGAYVTVTPDQEGSFEIEIIMPYRLLPPSAGEGPQIWTVRAQQVASVGDPVASKTLKLAIEKIIETIFIGMMATFFGVMFALPTSFFAAKNLMSATPITLGFYYVVRALLNIIRSIEPLIWAIIAVIAVGLGPFAGILALTIHSVAALAKLYSESIESIDPGPIEAIQATGANWWQTIMYAVIPQIIPPFVSFTIYRWDINIRMSTVIGFVGGGGIGFLLAQWIRLLDYDSAGIAVWFIAITVAILDYVSAEIRERFV
jgi:phosphonate transport system permease protein